MKDNIAALSSMFDPLTSIFSQNIPFVMNGLNRQCANLLEPFLEALNTVYEKGKPIIDPNMCQRITLICLLKQKMAELQEQFKAVTDKKDAIVEQAEGIKN